MVVGAFHVVGIYKNQVYMDTAGGPHGFHLIAGTYERDKQGMTRRGGGPVVEGQ